MTSESNYYFDDFHLDVTNRQLYRDGVSINLNARYFDALVLLVGMHGQLVGKDRFFSDVWDGVVVSDAALTQCIKDIRRKLGDDAANPHYIQTVPRYGYRFIGPVKIRQSSNELERNEKPDSADRSWVTSFGSRQLRRVLIDSGGGTLGGITAGLLGGLIYGLGLAYAPGSEASGGMGAASMLLVLICLSVLIGGMGGLGVSFGMAAASISTGNSKTWTIIGGTFGGLLVGGIVKLLGIDAFNLLFGTAPDGITGGLEGAMLGAAVALGATYGNGFDAVRPMRPMGMAALAGGMAGILISMAGGRLMSGSLELLTSSFAESKLQLDALGHFFGEANFGYLTQTVLAGIEGFLFGACVVGSIIYMHHKFRSTVPEPGK